MSWESLRARQRVAILSEAQNHLCAYCSIKMTVRRRAWVGHNPEVRHTDATIEHVQPLAEDGQREWANEVAACALCNFGRGVIPAMMYFGMVADLGRNKAHAWGIARAAAMDKQAHKARLLRRG